MEENPLCPPRPSLRNAESVATAEPVQADLIFVQHLGLVPKHIIAPAQFSALPAAERKWLGTDFSHVIVSQ